MMRELVQAMDRCSDTLWRDLLGMAALAVTFYALLHLPGFLAV